MAVEDAYELAYREAVRALEIQRAAVGELRARAGMLLATASIAVSLLGRDPSAAPDSLAWLVVTCFALLGMSVLAVVWPNADQSYDADPQALLVTHLARGAPDATALGSDLVAHIAAHRRANVRRLARMSTAFRLGACLLAIQMLLTALIATGIV